MNDDADDTPQEELRDTLTPFEAYDAVPLCPTCFNETDEDWEFCPTCYAPLGPFAGVDPLKYVYTMRFLIYQGVTRPTHLIIIVGLWLFYTIAALPAAIPNNSTLQSAEDIVATAIVGMFSVALSIWSVYLVTRNAVRLNLRTVSEDNDDDED